MNTTLEKANGTPVNGAAVASRGEPRTDPLAAAEAEAIRARTAAETDALRIEAEGKADAARRLAEAEAAKVEAEAEKLRQQNERGELRLRRERANEEAKIAEANRRRDEANRAAEKARKQEQAQTAIEAAETKKIERAESSWKLFAITFAIVCGVVALPVQMAAFFNDKAPWMISAPFMLEGAAWVVLRGAAAAVAAHRPHWHFRLIAWLLAFVSAGVNLWHGLLAFDPATAIGTAVASIAGPGVWDLYEHGRIRKRDGKLTWSQRRAEKKAAKQEAAEKAAKEAAARTEKEAAQQAAEEAATRLAETRAEHFPKVWEHAKKLAAALGESAVTETVWRRAHRDVEGADPGETVDVITARTVAERRVIRAREAAPGNAAEKTKNAQRANQMPRIQRGSARKPPVRRRGDTQKYVSAARRQMSVAAKNSAQEEAK